MAGSLQEDLSHGSQSEDWFIAGRSVAKWRDRARSYTPHVPPNPTVTLPASTMTGTCRPPERRIIRSSSFWSALTLM